MKTLDYIEAIKARYRQIEGKEISEYRVSKLLGVTHQTIAMYRKRGSTFEETTALRAAELLDLDPGQVLLDMQAERAKDARVRAVWQALAEHLHSAAAALMLAILAGVGMTVFPAPSTASTSPLNDTGYTLREVKRRPRS